MTAEKNRPPQWWSAPEALAWLTYRQSQAVYIVRQRIDREREQGNPGAEYPELLEAPRGVETPWTPLPDGMQPFADGGMVEGPRALARYCRERRLSAEGQIDGAGPVLPVPLEDWRAGKMEWRGAGVGQDYQRLRLFLVLPDGRTWGALHFRADELREVCRTIETDGFRLRTYTTAREARRAEVKLRWDYRRAARAAKAGDAVAAPEKPANRGRPKRGLAPEDAAIMDDLLPLVEANGGNRKKAIEAMQGAKRIPDTDSAMRSWQRRLEREIGPAAGDGK